MINLKFPKILCDDDCCESEPLSHKLAVAFMIGAAPIITKVAVAKFFPEFIASPDSPETPDEPEPEG